jgi:putative oxygen-independent coproporphyrinogen III oxidase
MASFSAPIPLSVYVHLPWCVRKCPYCDFNSHAAPDGVDERRYLDALFADLEAELPGIWGRRIESVFIGGGTPSLFSAEGIAALLEGLRARLPLRPDVEITLEANPGTFEQARFADYRAAGVNRLSIGVQSLDDAQLERLGRIHSASEALRAVDIARAAGFDNLNLDLMHGLPGQDAKQARRDLEAAIACEPTHLSYYQLTLEPNTQFHKYPPQLPDEDTLWDITEQGRIILEQAGYTQYEVSAYARGRHQCRHNLNYWEFGDYLGLGAGAHGKLTDPAGGEVLRTRKHRQPEQYMRSAREGSASSDRSAVPEYDLPFEFMLNALRLNAGFDAGLFPARAGLPLDSVQPILDQACERSLLTAEGTQYRPTELGRRFHNDLVAQFLSGHD